MLLFPLISFLYLTFLCSVLSYKGINKASANKDLSDIAVKARIVRKKDLFCRSFLCVSPYIYSIKSRYKIQEKIPTNSHPYPILSLTCSWDFSTFESKVQISYLLVSQESCIVMNQHTPCASMASAQVFKVLASFQHFCRLLVAHYFLIITLYSGYLPLLLFLLIFISISFIFSCVFANFLYVSSRIMCFLSNSIIL